MEVTTGTELVEDGQRRGRRGRRFVPEARRRELVVAYRHSGLTRTEFARREGLNYTTLCNWVQHAAPAGDPPGVRPADPKPPGPPVVRFAEVALPPAAASGWEVRLPDGTMIRGAGGAELAALVRVWRS